MNNIIMNNGVSIPAVGYGVWMIKDSIEECILAALECGYRHIDTATAYGNEQGVGRAIAASGLKREELFITTKLFNDDMRADRTADALKESLEKLGLDYVDLYLTHWPVKEKYISSYREMEKLCAQGLIKSIGVSNCLEHHLKDLLEVCEIVPAVNQVQIHPKWTQTELIDYCNTQGITVEAYSPLGHGNLLPNDILSGIADHHGKSAAQVVLRWHLQRGLVVLPKSAHKARIKENIDIFDFELTPQEMAEISSLNENTCYIAHPDSFDF